MIKIDNKEEIQQKINDYAEKNNMRIVNLSNKTLSFKLDGWSCYKSRTGKCSLFLQKTDDVVINSTNDQCGYSGKFDYCRDLADAMLTPAKFSNVYMSNDNTLLCRCSCGHYYTSGQHRLCVAKRLGINIPINEYNESMLPCRTCQNVEVFKLFDGNDQKGVVSK